MSAHTTLASVAALGALGMVSAKAGDVPSATKVEEWVCP